MNGPDSISDPVAPRISYTGYYISARGSAWLNLGLAQLNSARSWWHGRWDPFADVAAD